VTGEEDRGAEVDEEEASTPDETTPGRGAEIAHETETETIGKETVAQARETALLGECGNQNPVGVARTVEVAVPQGERGAFRPRVTVTEPVAEAAPPPPVADP